MYAKMFLGILIILGSIAHAENIQMQQGEVSFTLSGKNGCLISGSVKGKPIFKGSQEIWKFENQKETFQVLEANNRFKSAKQTEDRVVVLLENPILAKRNMSVAITYSWENNRLIKHIEITNHSDMGYFLQADSRSHLEQSFRKGGFYYFPSGDYVAADSVNETKPLISRLYWAINIQIASVINQGMVAASFPYRADGRLTNPMCSYGPPSYYTPDGWQVCSYAEYLKPKGTCSYDMMYYLFQGSPSMLIREWPELNEVKKIRQEVWKGVTVPAWLKDVSLVGFVYDIGANDQMAMDYFLKNVGPLAKVIPGQWMVMHWGVSHFGGNWADRGLKGPGYLAPVDPQPEDVKWATEDLPTIRKSLPNIKLGTYRMFYWCLDDCSDESLKHQDWKVYDKAGKPYYSEGNRIVRQVRNPAARDYCVEMTKKWYEKVPLDFHYIDGGDATGFRVQDWKHLTGFQWYDWHVLYRSIYDLVHRTEISPKVVLTNGPSVTVGDCCFMELGNFKDLWLDPLGWRMVADSCEYAKLMTAPQGFCSLLYWDKRTDLAYINAILAYGLRPNLAPGGNAWTGVEGLDFCLPRVPYIQAAFDIRDSKLVYPDLEPDWRKDSGLVEASVLKVGDTYRINLINHDTKLQKITVSFNPAILNLKTGTKVRMEQLQVVPPAELIAAKSTAVYVTMKSWSVDITAERARFEVELKPGLLNVVKIEAK
jgi:hypothetical protein